MEAIDIIIPVYGAYDLLRACIISIRKYTTQPYRLFLIDDNSANLKGNERLHAYLMLLSQSGVHVHLAKRRLGFPGNCNRGVAMTDSALFLLLNSDVEVLPNWLTALVEAARAPCAPGEGPVGIVGSRLLFPPTRDASHAGRIQHAGVAFNEDGAPYHPFRCYQANAPEVTRRLEINAVTGAVMLIRRSVWNEIGGFDVAFIGGQYEDMDFCLATRAAGYRIVYEPKSVLYHYEHGSGEEHVYASSVRNRTLLLQKWPDVPCDEHLFELNEEKAEDGEEETTVSRK